MKTSPTLGVIAAVAASLVLAGCYTQFGSTEEERPPDDVTYSEPDTLGSGPISAEAYEDARYRFYVNVGYPYWATGFSVGFWDPYPFDPWLWGPPAYWYPYGAYYSPGWYYPPAAYYPPAYWYGQPGVPYPGGYAAYTNRTFGTTRRYGSSPAGGGAYRTSPAGPGGTPAATLGIRPASTRVGRLTPPPAVGGRKATTPSAVDRPASASPASRQGRTGTRGTKPQVRPAPEQRQPQGSGSRQSVTPQSAPERKSDGSYARPRSGDSGPSRSSTPPPSYTAPSRSSGSEPRGSSSGGGSSSPRSGGRR